MGRAMVIRCFQGNNDIAILGQKQACLRNVWPSDMPPQMFEFLFLMELTGDADMQRKLSCLSEATARSESSETMDSLSKRIGMPYVRHSIHSTRRRQRYRYHQSDKGHTDHGRHLPLFRHAAKHRHRRPADP